MSSANPVVHPSTKIVLGLTREATEKATNCLNLARALSRHIPLLTLVCGTHAAEAGQLKKTYECPQREEGDGTLNLEWVDLNWDAFR